MHGDLLSPAPYRAPKWRDSKQFQIDEISMVRVCGKKDDRFLSGMTTLNPLQSKTIDITKWNTMHGNDRNGCILRVHEEIIIWLIDRHRHQSIYSGTQFQITCSFDSNISWHFKITCISGYTNLVRNNFCVKPND